MEGAGPTVFPALRRATIRLDAVAGELTRIHSQAEAQV